MFGSSLCLSLTLNSLCLSLSVFLSLSHSLRLYRPPSCTETPPQRRTPRRSRGVPGPSPASLTTFVEDHRSGGTEEGATWGDVLGAVVVYGSLVFSPKNASSGNNQIPLYLEHPGPDFNVPWTMVSHDPGWRKKAPCFDDDRSLRPLCWSAMDGRVPCWIPHHPWVDGKGGERERGRGGRERERERSCPISWDADQDLSGENCSSELLDSSKRI